MSRSGACAIFAALLFSAGCGSTGPSEGGGGGRSGDEIVLTLEEQNESGESGTATLTAEGDRTKVVLDVQDRSATMTAPPQPAHIHRGTCEKLNPTPAYGLSSVTAGKSTSTVDVSLADLRAGTFAINVRESVPKIDRYVACGDIGNGRKSGYDPPGHDMVNDY